MAAAVGAETKGSSRRRPRLVFIETQNFGRPNRNNSPRNQSDSTEEFLSWHQLLNEEFSGKWLTVLICLILLIFYRLIGGQMIISFFDPDEYWQSMEVAHNIVFGYGHMTWEWEQQIRSYLHPLVFAALYAALSFLGLDSPWMVQWSPRILQCFILVAQDVGVYLLALRMFPKRSRSSIASWSLTLQIVLWFNTYCGVRTYSNCIESCLILWGVLFWPFPDEMAISFGNRKISFHPVNPQSTTKHIIISLFFAGFSVAIRPTAAIFWINLALGFLLSRSKYSKKIFLVVCGVLGIFWISVLLVSDRIMYGSWVFVPWKFVQFNVLRGVGSYYGVHPIHWYFSNALPTVLFTLLPIFMFGVYTILRLQFSWTDNRPHCNHKCHGWSLLGAVLSFILLFSLLGHKEFRFLFPVVPFMMVISGFGANYFYKTKFPNSLKNFVLIALLVANVPMLCYFGVGHQVGTTRVMEYIQANDNVQSVYFLLPCHQTPYYSFIHRNISLAFPDCSPPVGDDPSLVGYETENSNFLSKPLDFVQTIFFDKESRKHIEAPSWLASGSDFPQAFPSHFVTYDKIAKAIISFFDANQYEECERFYHTLTPLDDIQSDVVVFCQKT